MVLYPVRNCFRVIRFKLIISLHSRIDLSRRNFGSQIQKLPCIHRNPFPHPKHYRLYSRYHSSMEQQAWAIV